MNASHVLSALLGALGGSIATIVWDTALKPRLLARSLAEVVAADLSLLVSSVAHDLEVRASAPRTIPIAQPFPLELYTAVASRLGELPSDTIIHVIATYRIFARLNEAAVAARASHAVLLDPASSHEQRGAAEKRLTVEIAHYGLQLAQAKAFVNHVQPKLIRTSRPWWSPRTWFSPRPQTLPKSQVVENLERSRMMREAELGRLR